LIKVKIDLRQNKNTEIKTMTPGVTMIWRTISITSYYHYHVTQRQFGMWQILLFF